MREWLFALAPIAVVAYFSLKPEHFTGLLYAAGRFLH
jgi:hypothetical protein